MTKPLFGNAQASNVIDEAPKSTRRCRQSSLFEATRLSEKMGSEGSARRSVDTAICEVVREALHHEIRAALREELAHLQSLARSTPGNETGYLSVAEAARVAHVHEGTIRKWMVKGWLGGYRAGRHRRVKRAELDQFMGALGRTSAIDIDERASELAAT